MRSKKAITLVAETIPQKIRPIDRVYDVIKKSKYPMTLSMISIKVNIGSGGHLTSVLRQLVAGKLIHKIQCPTCDQSIVYEAVK